MFRTHPRETTPPLPISEAMLSTHCTYIAQPLFRSSSLPSLPFCSLTNQNASTMGGCATKPKDLAGDAPEALPVEDTKPLADGTPVETVEGVNNVNVGKEKKGEALVDLLETKAEEPPSNEEPKAADTSSSCQADAKYDVPTVTSEVASEKAAEEKPGVESSVAEKVAEKVEEVANFVKESAPEAAKSKDEVKEPEPTVAKSNEESDKKMAESSSQKKDEAAPAVSVPAASAPTASA